MNEVPNESEKVKTCATCLRELPLKYFPPDESRPDKLAGTCYRCTFKDDKNLSKYWQSRFPELYEEPSPFKQLTESDLKKRYQRVKA